MSDKTEWIFGYGSLMSYHGLSRNTSNIEILDSFKVHIKTNRGFAKRSKRYIYCMDIEDYELHGRVINNYSKRSNIEGLLIKIDQNNFPIYCRREGYGYDNGKKIIDISSNNKNIGERLWKLYQRSINEVPAHPIRRYRENLYEEIGATSKNYIPHPLLIENLGYTIIFIAPGKYGTGDDNITSRKNEENIFQLMNGNEVLAREGVSKTEFADYFLDCLYGGVHGINVKDIINLVPTDLEFLELLQKNLTINSLNMERERFAEAIFNSLEKYERRFGKIEQNLKRSGLASFLT